MFEALVQEGDDGASDIADFESAAADILQGDEELASAYSAYVEARRRLNEKTRFRGFWPASQPTKGKSKGGFKGRGKSSKGFLNRKSLQQRILESRCRICNRVGHWKAKCPQRNNQSESGMSSRGSASQVPTSFVSAQTESLVTDGGLPLEFLQLPTHDPIMEDAGEEFSFVSFGGKGCNVGDSKTQLKRSLSQWEYRNHGHPFHRVFRNEARNVRGSTFERSYERAGILPSVNRSHAQKLNLGLTPPMSEWT